MPDGPTAQAPGTSGETIADWDRLGIRPGAVLRMFGMRRSGNHAVGAWLLKNGPSEKSVFLNNCEAGHHPLDAFRMVEVNGRHIRTARAKTNLPSRSVWAGDGATLLISYEDTSPAEHLRGREMSGDFDATLIDRDIVVYRSFLNWSASLLKKLQANARWGLVRRNVVMFRALDTYTRVLNLVAGGPTPAMLPVHYDRWCDDPDYRTGLLDALDFPVRDNSLGAVQRFGGGSSFQKDASSAEELTTAHRWKQMAEDPEYRALLYLCAMDKALMNALDIMCPEDAGTLRRLTEA